MRVPLWGDKATYARFHIEDNGHEQLHNQQEPTRICHHRAILVNLCSRVIIIIARQFMRKSECVMSLTQYVFVRSGGGG